MKTQNKNNTEQRIVHNSENVVEVRKLVKYFPIKGNILSPTKNFVKAVDGISFTIKRGQTMGLVGESGCGKTTVGRTLLRLNEKTSGEVLINGIEIHELDPVDLRKMRPKMQIIFQDPFSSLSPRSGRKSVDTISISWVLPARSTAAIAP